MAPFWEPPVNRPPEIVQPENEDNDVVLNASLEDFFVVANDPDDDQVYFKWDVPRNVAPISIDEAKEPGIGWTSRILIPSDPILDGSTLTCLVSDGQETRVLNWHLEVP